MSGQRFYLPSSGEHGLSLIAVVLFDSHTRLELPDLLGADSRRGRSLCFCTEARKAAAHVR